MRTSSAFGAVALALTIVSFDSRLSATASRVTECDRHTASQYDHQRVSQPVNEEKIDLRAALAACDRALNEEPESARYHFQLGVVLYLLNRQEDALRSLEKSAHMGYPAAHYLIGAHYFHPQSRDYKKAAFHLGEASKTGHRDAEFVLGVMYRKGLGVVNDLYAAFQLLKSAADKGKTPAKYLVGEMYFLGEGIRADKELARRYFQAAADEGDDDAKKMLRSMRRSR